MSKVTTKLIQSLKISILTHISVTLFFSVGLFLIQIVGTIIKSIEPREVTYKLNCPELGNTFVECSGWIEYILHSLKASFFLFLHLLLNIYYIIPLVTLFIIIFLIIKYSPKMLKKIYFISIPIYIVLSLLTSFDF